MGHVVPRLSGVRGVEHLGSDGYPVIGVKKRGVIVIAARTGVDALPRQAAIGAFVDSVLAEGDRVAGAESDDVPKVGIEGRRRTRLIPSVRLRKSRVKEGADNKGEREKAGHKAPPMAILLRRQRGVKRRKSAAPKDLFRRSDPDAG